MVFFPRWIPAAAVVVLGVVALAGYLFACGPVGRGRVEKFARRQRLTITVGNGNQVIRYLATTRRWRTTGFVVGLLLAELASPRPGEISTGAEQITVFAGWFLGALVAEVRVAHLEHGSVRAASLLPRQPYGYVRRYAWGLVPGAAVVAVATGAATAVADATGWGEVDWVGVGVWLALAIAVAVAVRSVQHAVLRRAQPLAAPDVIEADDAIRSRSLHVLSGGGAALVLFMVLNQLGAIHPMHAWDQSRIISVRVFGALAVAVLGWLVATSIWPPPRRTRRPSRPSVGAA